MHPTEGPDRRDFYLMCADLDATLAELKAHGVEAPDPISEERWGRMITEVQIPGPAPIQLYQPAHPRPLASRWWPRRPVVQRLGAVRYTAPIVAEPNVISAPLNLMPAPVTPHPKRTFPFTCVRESVR